MRYLGFIAVYLVCTWVLLEMPWPLDAALSDTLSGDIGLRTASMDETEPGYEPVVARMDDPESSAYPGRLREDPRLAELRRDVVEAGERLRHDLCNVDLRDAFTEAVLAFAEPVEEMSRDPSRQPAAERVVLNGQQVSTTLHLNTEALETIAWARANGIIYREDAPEDLRWLRRYLFSRDDRIVARALTPGC